MSIPVILPVPPSEISPPLTVKSPATVTLVVKAKETVLLLSPIDIWLAVPSNVTVCPEPTVEVLLLSDTVQLL